MGRIDRMNENRWNQDFIVFILFHPANPVAFFGWLPDGNRAP